MRCRDSPATTHLPDVPAIPGLSFRLFRGESDYPAMIAVLEGLRVADQLEIVVTVEDFEREYRHIENCDPSRDFLFAEVDGRVVGFTESWWGRDPKGVYLFNHHVPLLPEWRGAGLRNAMLRHNERVLRDIAATLPADGPRFFQSIVEETERDWIAVLESEGYTVYRYGLRLLRPDLEGIPDLPLPEGIEVRPAKPEHYRAIIDAWNEACRDMRGQIPISDEGFEAWRESPTFDPSLWQIAWHGDEVVGTVLAFINAEENEKFGRKRGHPEFVSVRRSWRGRDLAKALLARSLRAFKDRGMTEAGIGVDAENPSGARHLYEKMGFKVVKRAAFYRKPVDAIPSSGD